MEHGGPVIQKPISEVAAYIKKLIPADIPETYALNPRFEHVAGEAAICRGVIAYRDFLLLFCDRLITEGHLHFKLKKAPKSETDYPFLYSITDLLADIGYHGRLSESGNSLLLTEIPAFIAWADENGTIRKPKNSAAKLVEGLRFLRLCGFEFAGIDLDVRKPDVSNMEVLEVVYPDEPALLAGLKALAIADIEVREKRYISDNNHDNLLRCDYRLLRAEESDVSDVLKDFLQSLPGPVQKFALELHQHYIDMGMICVTLISTFEMHFAYACIKNSRRALSKRDIYQQRVWEFALSVKYGYCLAVRAKNTDKYAAVIETFSVPLKEKVKKGYGCDRKLRNEPCQGGCQGVKLPLDESILDISREIETWLDHELLC